MRLGSRPPAAGPVQPAGRRLAAPVDARRAGAVDPGAIAPDATCGGGPLQRARRRGCAAVAGCDGEDMDPAPRRGGVRARSSIVGLVAALLIAGVTVLALTSSHVQHSPAPAKSATPAAPVTVADLRAAFRRRPGLRQGRRPCGLAGAPAGGWGGGAACWRSCTGIWRRCPGRRSFAGAPPSRANPTSSTLRSPATSTASGRQTVWWPSACWSCAAWLNVCRWSATRRWRAHATST